MQRVALALAAAVLAGGAIASSPAFAGSSSTVRIETRPYYGAVVTLEEGVRVFRPLPRTDKIIINPGGQTPLSLSLEEVRSVSRNYNYSYNRSDSHEHASGYSDYQSGFAGHRGRRHHGGSGAIGLPKGHHGHGGHGGHGKH